MENSALIPTFLIASTAAGFSGCNLKLKYLMPFAFRSINLRWDPPGRSRFGHIGFMDKSSPVLPEFTAIFVISSNLDG